jgi:hypothetical protein
VKPDRDGDGDDDPSTVAADRIAIVPRPETPPPSDDEHRHHHLAGTVTDNDGSALVVDTGDDDVTVKTDDQTGVTKTTVASFDDVQVDRYVKVHGARESEDDSGVLLARFVHIRLTLPAEPAHQDEPAPAPAAVAPASPSPGVQAAAADTSSDDQPVATTTDPATVKVRGLIESISDPTFTLHRRDGSTVTITTTSGTTYLRKQQDGTVAAGSFADLQVGDRVLVEGTDDGNGAVTATRVLSGDCDRSGDGTRFRDGGGDFQRAGGDWGDRGGYDGGRYDGSAYDGGAYDGRHR